MGKKKVWVRFRHKVVTALVRPFFKLYASLKYHIKIDRFRGEGKRNWLVLVNHQTDFDQFFVGLAFHQPVYYVAMEDVFSNGFTSRLIEWLTAPIPIVKGSVDIGAIKTCIRVAREGGSIALFPEGNRTYSGRMCNIKPGVAALAKKLGMPIAIYRIEGGYGVKPRWADDCRRGKMRAGVRSVIEPEEYAAMTNDELYSRICRELRVDETENKSSYYSKTTAEGLERVLYVCPECGMTEFDTEGDIVTCRSCGKRHRYRPDMTLEALDGETRFEHVADWYEYQESFVRSLDLTPYAGKPAFTDTADLYEVILFQRKQPMAKQLPISIYADRLELGTGEGSTVMYFADVRAMACIAGHKLNIFHGDKIYQIKGNKHFNALKYCNLYYHAKYIGENHTNGEFQFLGL